MLITRTPLRISIGGGGTDLPSYYRQHGGFVISAAINRYVYVGINHTFTNNYFLKYSALELVDTVDEIQHAIIREALKSQQIGPAVEIVSLADIPSGTGLGSSGTFTVGLLRALHSFKCEYVSAQTVAEEACRLEIDVLERAVGKQDQYIAAFGGLTCFDFAKDDSVSVSPLRLATETMNNLEEHLFLFFTGYSRSADEVLSEQKTRSEKADNAMVDNLHRVKESGYAIKGALERGDCHAFARMMHEHWLNKMKRSKNISNERINKWYEIGIANGALGGKLVGAGGGGFLMFYAEDRIRLRRAMAEQGLTEVRFTFDYDGSTVIVRN